MARKLDDYQPLKFYKDNTKAKQSGFSKFEVDGEHYFCRYVDGDIALISQSYSGKAGRDNGIESVRKNEKIKDRYRFEARDGGKYGFSLLAGNRQEIAVSPNFGSESKATTIAGRLNGSIKKAAPKKAAPKKAAAKKPAAKKAAAATGAAFTSGDGRRGNYKPLDYYTTHGGTTQDGFDSFTHDGAHYFTYRTGGQVHLISESYTSEAGRDNGIASVKKNLGNAARYKHRTHSNGQHYFDLVAGNNQEIATSPWYDSDAAAKDAAATLRGEKTARKSEADHDNYRELAFYEAGATGKADGLEGFRGDDGLYYFVYRKDGRIQLISEGYPTAAAQKAGMASVEKNLPNADRYDHKNGGVDASGFRLKAGNNREIARSVGYGTAAAGLAGAALLRGERGKERAPNIEDNYRPLAFYTGATTGNPKNGIEKFRGEDGGHYFVYNEDGKVALISEAYPTAAARDTGAAAVEKNISLENRYDYSQGGVDGKTGFRLRAGNNKEIARSVAYGSAAAATAGAAYLLGTRKRTAPKPKPAPKPTPPVAPVAAAAVGAAALAGAAAARDPNRDKTDDYLACEAYEGRPLTDRENRVALFQHENGQHYFAFYHPDGEVRWRSEGFPTPAARQEELDIALRLHNNGEYVKRLERGDRYIDLLHDETGREIARSCLCTAAPVVPVAAAAAPVAAAAVAAAPAAAATGGGLGWLKWVLLGLLGLLALWGLSRCFGGDADVVAPAAQAPAPVAMVTCWNGTETETRADCPAKITCEDGSEVTNRADCPVVEAAPVVPTVTCWDGSTAQTRAECPVRPTVTCWDGSTAFTRTECPARPAPPVRATATAGSLAFFNTEACIGNYKRVSRLGSNPEYGDSHSLTPSGFYDKLARQHALGGVDRTHLNALFRNLGYPGGFADADPSMFSNATIESGTTGILGYGQQHGLQCSNLLPTSNRDLEAFAIQGANGRTVYFMKTCGNYFYPG